ncbi:MAG TPA: HpsJ family protein [Trichocoleus sp.]|jgi:hypothetical protein
MASFSTPTSNAANLSTTRGICQIAGLTCLVGFAIDLLVLLLPPELGNAQWRFGVMQQLADRSIVLFFGAALMIFGSLDSRRGLKRLSTLCMATGVAFFLFSLLVITDCLKLREQATNNISAQETQVQTQIRNAQTNPGALSGNVKAEDLQRLSEQLSNQAKTLKESAQTGVVKTGAASIGNLIVVGLGLIGLGRYGMNLRRSKAL